MKRLLTSAAMFLCCIATMFAQFTGSGSGTENDPYLIFNPIQLNQVRNYLNQDGVYFKLMDDIDLADYIENEYGSQGWLPIGNASLPFKGIIDGNGKTISGLYINRRTTENVGLFAYISNSEIKDLTLKFNIIGYKNVGALVGLQGGDTNYTNIKIEGVIEGEQSVGGLIGSGKLYGYRNNINSISAKVSVIATGDNAGGIVGFGLNIPCKNCKVIDSSITGSNYVGGISGEYGEGLENCIFVGVIKGVSYVGGIGNSSNITNCYALGKISATGDYVGGLLGSGNASDSYFCGNVNGVNCVGGLVGNCGGVTNSYANATVKGYSKVGGVCGYLSNGSIFRCAYTGPLLSSTNGKVGRIVGSPDNPSVGEMGTSNENRAYNRTIVINAGVAQEIVDDKQNGTGSSATTLKLKATYVAMGWDFTNTWAILETECYPYMKTQTAPPVITSQVVSGATTVSGKCIDGGTITLEIDGVKQQMVSTGNTFSFTVSPLQASHEVRVSAKADGKEQSYYTTEIVSYLGTGSEADPYQVYTAADLTGVYRKGYFKLMNDLDLTSYINQFSPTEGWESIGREGSETIHFDGNGHKITGLWCNSTRDNAGLFSCFANGTIKDLTVEVANGKQVKGGSNTGILIGKMINGTLENCRVLGTVADGTPVGGMVGLFDGGSITRCQASVTINATVETSYVGGLVGEITSGTIDKCFTTGSLIATGTESYVGGLVGNNSATITNCYSTATVTSSYNAAGLVAYNYGVVDKCYATGNLYSNNYAAGVIGYNDGTNAVIRNCVATNNIINVTYESQQVQQSGGYGQRIIGGIKNDAPAPEMNNYALKTMQVSLNNVPQVVYDDLMNGTAKTAAELAQQATYATLGWDFGETWTMPADGYPELTWLATAAEPEVTLGDLNNDGTINITDVVLIIDVMAGLITDAYQVAAADVNGDGSVNITDCVATIDLMAAQQTSSPLMAMAPAMSAEINDYISGNFQEGNLTIDLNNESRYTAFQMMVSVPEGMSIVKARMDKVRGAEHQVFVRNIGEGQYLVAGFSLDNEELTGNSGQLLTITTEGQSTGDIVIDDVQFATVDAETIHLAGITVSGSTTGIADMNVNSEQTVYDLQGRKLDSQILRSHRMQGSNQIVIVNGKKVILK